MIESFVDLTYRGMSLARRVKLTQVRPTTCYLEMPTPMPVGTSIRITTDDGIELEATVMSIHEQVGGSDKPPGMTVAPKLAADASDPAVVWFKARVALPEETAPAPSRTRSMTVRPRSHTVPQPPSGEVIDAPRTGAPSTPPPLPPPRPASPSKSPPITMTSLPPPRPPATPSTPPPIVPVSVVVVAPERAPDSSSRTEVMEAPDPEAVAPDTAVMDAVSPEPDDVSDAQAVVVDDDRRTVLMNAVDPSAIDPGASGSIPSLGQDPTSPPRDRRPTGGFYSKKRRKKR
ncbi:MAG: hypothetical protein AB7R00_20960 [Kofleriaceae bacterium]